MKAAIIRRFGTADVFEISDVEKPFPSDQQVLIKVNATGINPVDTKVRAGSSGISKQIQMPAILGWDVSGVIESVGKNVSTFNTGDAVFGCIAFPALGKTYAEYCVADPKLLAKKPANISFDEAAGVPIAGLTAYQVIYEHLKLIPGQKILIQAAAGGVGHLAVQFAKLNGAIVAGTASGKNAAFLKSIGVDQVIDYNKEKFEEVVGEVDAVVDAMGGEILYRSLSCVKNGGTVICLPSSTKNDPKALQQARLKEVKLIWPMMYPDGAQMEIIARLLQQKKLKVHIDKIFTLDQVEWAHKSIETHNSRGKVVMRIQ